MPGLLTATVGGHYAAGEVLADVLREAQEEIGVSVQEGDLLPLGVWRYEDTRSDPGIVDREWQDVLLWPLDLPLEQFVCDPPEVAALVELQAAAVLSLLDNQVPCVTGNRCPAGAHVTHAVPVSVTDLVPTPEYHRRIALAALSLCAGRRPVLGAED